MTTSQLAEPALLNSYEKLQGFQCFFTPFWVCDNPDAEAIKPGLLELVERVQQHERGASEAKRSNRGCWRSNTLAIGQPGLSPLMPWLKEMFGQVVSNR